MSSATEALKPVNSAAAAADAADGRSMPARIGAELVARFDAIAHLPDKAQWVLRHVLAGLVGPRDPALTCACETIAAAIDAQAERFDDKAYHNRQHFCEVVLTAATLCALDQRDAESTQWVVLAALVHDLVHERGIHPAFSQERASVACALGLVEGLALPATTAARLSALVLATDTAGGIGYMAAVCQAPDMDTARAIAVPPGAPELALLAAEPDLAALARILCAADVLPSIGLTADYALHLQGRLALEWGRRLGVDDKLRFMDEVLQRGYIGPAFLPHVRAIRDHLSREAHAFGQG